MDTDLSRYFSSAPDQSSKRPQTSNKASYSGNLSFRFPSYRNILWDRRPVDDLIFEIKAERFLPTMVVPIHILEQAVQYARMSCDGWSGNFIGRYKSESDSYLVVIDNFLPYCPDKKSYSDLVHIHTGALSFESIVRDAITELQSDEFPCVSSFIQAFCQINETPEGLCLHGHLVVPTSSLRFSLIKPLRILNNPLGEALQKGNLSLPLNSTFQFGYLTLDQVRNAVPLQFNDALAFKWPLIGIWIFGQKSDVSIESVHVWTSCMRFLYNESVKDRVSPEPMTFLVLIVHPGHHNCEFFECQAIPSNNVLRLYDFGMRSLCLASQAKTELSFRWSIDVTDAHHEEFQGCLGSFGALDSINDCSSSSAERLRGTQRSTSVPPLDVSSNYREHLSNYRSSSVSPHATSVAPTLEVPTNAPQPLESAETLMIGVHDKHELLDKDLPADASSIPSKSHSEDISSTKHESYFPVKSHSSSSAHTSVVNHHQSNLDCDAVSLGGLSIKLNTYEQDLKDLSDCSKASHLKFLEYHKRQFELLQEQVNSLRETFESRLKHICCCSTKIHEFHNDNVKLPPTKGESSRPSEEISRSVMASNSSQSVIVSSRSQAVETVETSSSSYQQPTDNTSSGSSADAPSVRSAISSSKSSRRQSFDHPVNDDGCRLASIAVEIKTSSIGSTSTASGLPTPERSASSHADSRVVDSVSESSWAHDHQDNTSPHEAQVGKRSFMECKKTDPSPFAELIEPLTDDHYASDNETVDIPRIQFASFEDSSDDDLDEISRRYLNDKLSSGPGSEDTTTGALHTSKYLLSFPDKN